MGMLMRRHYANVNNSETKGVTETVAPKVEETEKVIAPSKSEKSATYGGVSEKKYTRTEINRTSTSELRKIADSVGIEDADKYTGSELKRMLIEKLV